MSANSPNRPGRAPTALPLALAVIATVAGIAGCSTSSGRQESSGLFSPYRTDLPQGNYVTREMLDQVQRGMSREQVRAALGSPLLAPVFRSDRWDYVFRYQRPNGEAEQRRVVIRFQDDRVDAIEADPLPLREDPDDPALPGGARVKKKPAPAPAAVQGTTKEEKR